MVLYIIVIKKKLISVDEYNSNSKSSFIGMKVDFNK